MDRYFAYWKRGWWVWLLMLIANFSLMLVVVPLAVLFSDNLVAYWAGAAVAWLAIYAPLWGWLFEKFASGSQRIGSVQAPSCDA
jgi:ABC-type glycerol-3-phosphate transport system permease component